MLMKELVKFFVRVNLVSPSDGQVSTVYAIPRDLGFVIMLARMTDRKAIDKPIELVPK